MQRHDPSYPIPGSEAVSRVMRANRKTDSRPEVTLRHELFRRGARYRKNPPVRTSLGTVRPDLVFLRLRVAVFVDGCFWHSCPVHGNIPNVNRGYWGLKLARTRERDHRVNDALASEGWTVLRVWEHEPMAEAVARIGAALKQQQRSDAGGGDGVPPPPSHLQAQP